MFYKIYSVTQVNEKTKKEYQSVRRNLNLPATYPVIKYVELINVWEHISIGPLESPDPSFDIVDSCKLCKLSFPTKLEEFMNELKECAPFSVNRFYTVIQLNFTTS